MILMSPIPLREFYAGRHNRSREKHNLLLGNHWFEWGLDVRTVRRLFVPRQGVTQEAQVEFTLGWQHVYIKLIEARDTYAYDNPNMLPIHLLSTVVNYQNKNKIIHKTSRNCCF